MTESGFVVNGNKKAWRKYALRAVLCAIAAAELQSLIPPQQHLLFSHLTPWNVIIAIALLWYLTVESVRAALDALSTKIQTRGNPPFITVDMNGVVIKNGVYLKGVGYQPRRLGWEEIRTIYVWRPQRDLRFFKIPYPPRIVVMPYQSESSYRRFEGWESHRAFDAAYPQVSRPIPWVLDERVMEISPDEFMRRLKEYYETYAWRPGLPGGPYPSVAARGLNPFPALSASPSAHEANVVQSRNVCHQTRVLNTGQTQRRAFHRTLEHHNAGNRRRVPNPRRAERLSLMLKQDTQTEPIVNAAPLTGDTDQRVTPHELTAAIESIERRKAEAQKRMAETIPVDQAVRELGIDATPEEVLAEVRAQRAAREGGTPTPPVEKPVPPLAVNDKQRFEAFLRQFVKESGLDALPDEIIARLRARRLARAQGTAVVQPVGGNTGFSNKRSRRGMGIGIAAFLFFGWSTGWWQHAPTFPFSSGDTTPITKTLASIPDNHPVTSDTENLQKIIEGKPANTISVIDNEDVDSSEWTVEKKSGHYFVRAYLPARISEDALKTAPVKLYNAEHDTPGDDSVEVTVPLDGTHVAASHEDGEDSTITLTNVHLDDSSYDKW